MATTNEIEALKKNWRYDPIWNIEDTEGFEEHREELRAYRLDYEKRWRQIEADRIADRAKKLECSVALVKQIEKLESYIEALEIQLERYNR